MNVLKNSTTTRNAAEMIKVKVPKKKESLARPFIVFAPATERMIPMNDSAKLAIYKPCIRSTASTDPAKLKTGKKNTSVE